MPIEYSRPRSRRPSQTSSVGSVECLSLNCRTDNCGSADCGFSRLAKSRLQAASGRNLKPIFENSECPHADQDQGSSSSSAPLPTATASGADQVEARQLPSLPTQAVVPTAVDEPEGSLSRTETSSSQTQAKPQSSTEGAEPQPQSSTQGAEPEGAEREGAEPEGAEREGAKPEEAEPQATPRKGRQCCVRLYPQPRLSPRKAGKPIWYYYDGPEVDPE